MDFCEIHFEVTRRRSMWFDETCVQMFQLLSQSPKPSLRSAAKNMDLTNRVLLNGYG